MASEDLALNFWLWGIWGTRKIPTPFLTQKLPGKIRDVIIGSAFIIALKEDGSVYSWGEDKHGCLGLGNESHNKPEPEKIMFPSDAIKVVDIQYGKKHVLSLTNEGKVYAWGDNSSGQLGVGDTQQHYEPTAVAELENYTVIQILAVDNMSYALTSHGVVFGWGDNNNGILGLEISNQKVPKPEPMTRVMERTKVKKLMIKDCGQQSGKGGKTVVAFVEMAEPLKPSELPGGFQENLGDVAQAATKIDPKVEQDIFEGVNMMRKVMDNAQKWFKQLECEVRHGGPYKGPENEGDRAEWELEVLRDLDAHVSLEMLDKAGNEIDKLIDSGKDQIREVRKKPAGNKTVEFMLTLFIDDCLLRKEKIQSTHVARVLLEHKKSTPPAVTVQSRTARQKIDEANRQLTHQRDNIKHHRTYNKLTQVLQETIMECIECKLQVNDMHIECMKARQGEPADMSEPACRVIKQRWNDLKVFSIYNLYQEFQKSGASNQGKFNSDEDLLIWLEKRSDEKMNHLINIDNDDLISHDVMIETLVYQLLRDYAELKKMCNKYQLKVLLSSSKAAASRQNNAQISSR